MERTTCYDAGRTGNDFDSGNIYYKVPPLPIIKSKRHIKKKQVDW
jgi:hypothetical protein